MRHAKSVGEWCLLVPRLSRSSLGSKNACAPSGLMAAAALHRDTRSPYAVAYLEVGTVGRDDRLHVRDAFFQKRAHSFGASTYRRASGDIGAAFEVISPSPTSVDTHGESYAWRQIPVPRIRPFIVRNVCIG